MAFGAWNTIRIEITAVVRLGAAGHRGEIFPQEQAVVAIGLAFVILSGQLQLLVVIDIDSAGAHHVEAIGILQAGLSIINQDFVALAVIPATVALIGDRQPARGVVVAAADRCRYVLVVVCVAAKACFTADLQFNLLLFLAFFGNDVDQATGAAAAVQRGSTGDHFNVIDIKGIDRIQLATVAAR
ncbi:hypothetical protein D3C72_1323590 [compost metagenome]